MLFNHLSLRSGIKSTIITSNQAFDKWQDTFEKDTVLTAALLEGLIRIQRFFVSRHESVLCQKIGEKAKRSVKM